MNKQCKNCGAIIPYSGKTDLCAACRTERNRERMRKRSLALNAAARANRLCEMCGEPTNGIRGYLCAGCAEKEKAARAAHREADKRRGVRTCYACGVEVSEKKRFCPECNEKRKRALDQKYKAELAAQRASERKQLFCQQCGTPLPDGAPAHRKFCDVCNAIRAAESSRAEYHTAHARLLAVEQARRKGKLTGGEIDLDTQVLILQRFCQSNRLKQADIAAKTGTPPGSVSRWFSGRNAAHWDKLREAYPSIEDTINDVLQIQDQPQRRPKNTLRVCRDCGQPFDDPREGVYLCRSCAESKKHRSTLMERTCKTCGKTFSGGPRAYYCPYCREERKRARERQYKANGASRKLGSIDQCARCWKDYVVVSGLQRYCPDCAKDALLENERPKSRAYMEQRRKSGTLDKNLDRICIICGKPFRSSTATVTCSPECAKENRRRKQAKADAKRRKK